MTLKLHFQDHFIVSPKTELWVTRQHYIITPENVLPIEYHCSTTNCTHVDIGRKCMMSPETKLSITRQCRLPHYQLQYNAWTLLLPEVSLTMTKQVMVHPEGTLKIARQFMVTSDATITKTKQFMVTTITITYNDNAWTAQMLHLQWHCNTCHNHILDCQWRQIRNYWHHEKVHGAKLNLQWQLHRAWLDKPMLPPEIVYPHDNTVRRAKVTIHITRQSMAMVPPKGKRLMTRECYSGSSYKAVQKLHCQWQDNACMLLYYWKFILL